MERINIENACDVDIKWTNPIQYNNVFKLSDEKLDDAWFYKIIAKYSNGKSKLLYIGKTERLVSDRLKDSDHKRKIKRFKEDYPNHKVFVSLGNVVESGNYKSKTIDQIETLLIYSHADLKHIENKTKIWSHHIQNEYKVINRGYRKDGMYREIFLGVFCK